MKAVGIIFANLHERNIPELTRIRTIGSIPFGCRYRLIDFTLSNMVNSGITDIRVITQYNYQSLMDHIGSGKDWDLARRSGGIKVLPPNYRANGFNAGPRSRLESLMPVADNLSYISEEYVIMADCDNICNIDFNGVLEDHIKNGADITMMVRRVRLNGAMSDRVTLVDSDAEGNITDLAVNPLYAEGDRDMSLNIIVTNRTYLQAMVQEALAHGYTSMSHDIIRKNIGRRTYRIYRYDEGAFANITSLADYYATSMALLEDQDFREGLFGDSRHPIITKVRNSAPTRYRDGSHVKNSLIADGCTIDGTVENCILFRGVKVGKGAVVKNCILFQDTTVGENAFMNCVISDKNAVIRDGNVLSGHPQKPYYIDKKQML